MEDFVKPQKETGNEKHSPKSVMGPLTSTTEVGNTGQPFAEDILP